MSRHHNNQWKGARDLSLCHDNIVMSQHQGTPVRRCSAKSGCRDKRIDVTTLGETIKDCKVQKWMSRQEQDVATS